jgi:hypothetical protein
MKTLREINEELKALYGETSLDFTDKGADTGHSYIDFYAKHFDPKRDEFVRMLEVGISSGGSAYLWGKYFNDFDYHTFDIASGFAQPCEFQKELIADDRMNLYWNINAFDIDLRDQIGEKNVSFIIDDGDHRASSQYKVFQNYWVCLDVGGVYFVEDVHKDSQKSLVTNLEFFLKSTGDQYEIDTYFGKRIVEGRLDDIIIAVKKLG